VLWEAIENQSDVQKLYWNVDKFPRPLHSPRCFNDFLHMRWVTKRSASAAILVGITHILPYFTLFHCHSVQLPDSDMLWRLPEY
jgi:hypothetical protein